MTTSAFFKGRYALVAVIVVALGGAAWLLNRPEPTPVETVAVAIGSVRATVSNTRAGTLEACRRARLAPTISGQIVSLPVTEGDRVAANDVLLELWSDDQRAQVMVAKRELVASQAQSQQACAIAEVARREADRIGALGSRNAASEGQVDITESDARAKAAACRAARGMIEVNTQRIAAAEAVLERTVLRAPFEGIVAEVNGEIGEVVTPSPVGIPTPPAIDLIDTSCLYVKAPIDEIDAPAVRTGMRATVGLDAFPDQVFEGIVRRIAPYVSAVEKQARTVDVEVEIEQANPALLPGFSADVEIVLDEHIDTLHLPAQAVQQGNRVFVVTKDQRIESREVRTGLRNWQHTEILSGLEEGEQVVLSARGASIKPGDIVTPVEPQAY